MNFLIQFPVLIFSVILHEYAHGWMAEKRGDDTARIMGRLTFNPIPHIDPVGPVLLPLVAALSGAPVFGWAKPVPVNPSRLENPLRDMVWVSLAGPAANFMLAIAAALLMWALRNVSIFPVQLSFSMYQLLKLILVINIILPVFNLFPIPPLDGSRVVERALPPDLAYRYSMLEPYGFIIIMVLLYTGIFWAIMGPIAGTLIHLLSGGI